MPVPRLDSLLDELGTDDPLHRLVAAEQLAAALQQLGDRLLGAVVDEVRDAGLSWSDIGEHVGITRQAAQQRYTPRWSSLTLSDLVETGRLERHTERARRALLAAERAARHNHDETVDPVHLLLGVLASPGLGRDVAGPAGRRLRLAVERLLRRGTSATTEPPISAATRRCLRATVAEALDLGHNYIGTEHQLLGVLHDADVATLAARHGIALGDELRDEVRRRVLAAAGPPRRSRRGGA